MGIHILHDESDEMAVMYCSTTDWAFGPVFYHGNGYTASEWIEKFLDHLKIKGIDDPRSLDDVSLERIYYEWMPVAKSKQSGG